MKPNTLRNYLATQKALVEEFPLHVVTRWIGNSARVANDHYLVVRDEHFERAAAEKTHEKTYKSGAVASRAAQNPAQ